MKIPPSLPAECELPLPTPPDIYRWSENFCYQVYDEASNLTVWFHIGLSAHDIGVWHEKIFFYLPDGEELLVTRNFSARKLQSFSGPSGATLRGEYDAASGEWLWRFQGVAERVRRSDLYLGLKREGIVEPASFELRYSGICPVWDLTPNVADQVWAVKGAHWEQPCTVSGWVEYGGKRTVIDGHGIRDHSRGVRDFSQMGPSYWMHGQFPSGRAFGFVYLTPTETQPNGLSHAYVVYDGALLDAEVMFLPADRSFKQPFEICFRDLKGEHRLTGELLHEVPFTIWYPYEYAIGHDRSRAAHLFHEGQIRWNWDGETGYGLGERSVKLDKNGVVEISSITAVNLV